MPRPLRRAPGCRCVSRPRLRAVEAVDTASLRLVPSVVFPVWGQRLGAVDDGGQSADSQAWPRPAPNACASASCAGAEMATRGPASRAWREDEAEARPPARPVRSA